MREIKKNTINLFNSNRNADLAEALMEFGATVCKPKNPLCYVCNIKKECKFFKNKNKTLQVNKKFIKEKNYNIFCYLKKRKKEIALIENTNLSFLRNFKMPETKIALSSDKIKRNEWIYLCNYKNNISNIKMNINLFYQFTKNKPAKFKWYSINRSGNEFIPSFTKKIFRKVSKLYI